MKKIYSSILYVHVSSIELQILLEISSFLWCYGYSPVSETGFSWSLAQCFPTQCCRSQSTALDKKKLIWSIQSWLGHLHARAHNKPCRAAETGVSVPLESCLCSWPWPGVSQVHAPSAGVHSPCWGVYEIPCPSVCQILLSLCSSKSNIQWTFHPQTFPLCNANFALPCHNLTFSRYSSLLWPFFFNFHIYPWLSQLHLCSKVETFSSVSLSQAYPTFAFSSDSSYSLN